MLTEAAKTDFDATVAWLAAHPSHMGHDDMMGLANAVTERLNADPIGFLRHHAADGSLEALMPAIGSAILNRAGGQREPIWEWLKAQPETGGLEALRQHILSSAGWQDPEFAMSIVADLPRTEVGDRSVQNIASHLLNSGDLSRFDTLMAQAPERLRQPLLNAAFNCLRADNLDDPHKWLALAAQVPESDRANLTSRVAAAWAEKEPEDAIAWATSLPEGESRLGVLGSTVSSWAVRDAYGASEWISTLPDGPDRDRAAGSLACAIAGDAPEEAWQWALSISDTSLRNGPALRALEAMHQRDPETASQWLESAAISAHDKTQLRLALQNRRADTGPRIEGPGVIDRAVAPPPSSSR